MSPTSITNPSAWMNPAGQNPLAAASAFGSGNFTSLLTQALQSGNTAAPGTAAAASTVNASGAGSLAGAITRKGHHGHHGGGGGGLSAQQLLSMLQQINASGTSASGTSASGTSASGAAAIPAPAATVSGAAAGAASAVSAATPTSLPALLSNLLPGSLAARGVGQLLSAIA